MLGYKQGDELKQIISHAKFTVVPSEWHDNSPLVIYESLALGKPVIGSRMGGIPELINESIDGYTFDRGDIQDFAHKVNDLLQHQEKVVTMGKAGRNKVEELYSFEKMRANCRQIFASCPFHNEKTPSFCIYLEDNRFYCYGCHCHGDAIEFLMKLKGINFRDAVEQLMRG